MLLSVLKRILVPSGTRQPSSARKQPAAHAELLRCGLDAERSGQMEKAEAFYRRAVCAAPADGESLLRLGEVMLARRNPEEAAAVLQRAAVALPASAIVHFRLAGAYIAQGRRDEAIPWLRKAAAMQDGFVPALNDLGNVSKELGRLDEAQAYYRDALKRDPDFAIGWHNLGCVLRDKGDFEGALECFDRSLSIKPDHHDARLARALVLLGMSRFTEGWRDYRARREFPEQYGERRGWGHPQWRGESLTGRSLLIWSEQGVGDQLLLASLCDEVASQAVRCTLECHAKLVPLLQRSLPAVEVVAWRSPPDPRLTSGFDYQTALGELAALLRPDRASFPTQKAYLRADPDRIAYWRGRLRSSGPGLNVGFCWRSRDLSGERALACATLEQWRPVLTVPGARFVCLQYDECRAELQEASRRLGVDIAFYPEVDLLDDLDETAALMCALDLVISAPTAVSVQAAALGVETWQLSYGYDWQYGGTDRNLWLPSMVRFHRRWDESWEDVLDLVANRLGARVRSELAMPHGAAPDDQPRTLLVRLLHAPGDYEVLYAAAEAAASAGRHCDAVGYLRRAVAARPDAVQAHLLLGDLTRRLGWWDEAIGALQAARELLPEQASLLVNLGAAYEANGDRARAEESYRMALQRDPRMAAAHLNLGNILRSRGALPGARTAYLNALALEPGSGKAHANLANLYKLEGNLGAAERHFSAALALEPHNARWLLGLGATLHDMGLLQDALALYDEALTQDPGCREAQLNTAHALLARGDLARGWAMHDVRFDLPAGGVKRRHVRVPRWRGESLAGGSLVVWGEQGIGDEILFASMYPELPASDGDVVIECHAKLRALFQRSFPGCRVLDREERSADMRPEPAFDFQIASGSLGSVLRADSAHFPARRAYLVADASRTAHWRKRLAASAPGLKVGFCWRSSNIEGERALSCTQLADWRRLFAMAGVHWISLQYDECLDELQQAMIRDPNRILHFDEVDYRDDLDEVSALIAGLDLVISAPTTVSIHAAALGIETWQFSFGADWQTLGTGGNPWLPAMRRYPRAWTERWDSVFARIAGDLAAVAERRRGPLAVERPC